MIKANQGVVVALLLAWSMVQHSLLVGAAIEAATTSFVPASKNYHYPHHRPHRDTCLAYNGHSRVTAIFHGGSFLFRNTTRRGGQNTTGQPFQSPPPPPPLSRIQPPLARQSATRVNADTAAATTDVGDTAKDKDTTHDKNRGRNGHHHDPATTKLLHHPAVHVVEHRAKDRVGYNLAHKVTETLVHSMEQLFGRARTMSATAATAAERTLQRGGRRVAEEVTEKTITRVGRTSGAKVVASASERAGERTLEGLGERWGRRLFQKSGSTTVKKAAQQGGSKAATRTAERLSERALGGMGERVGEQAAKQGVTVAAERIGERALERVGERVVEQSGTKAATRVAERVGERVVEGAGERVAEQAAKKAATTAAERIGERALEQVGERVVEQMGTKAAARAAERVGERALVEGVGVRSLEQVGRKGAAAAAVKASERVGERTLERAGERLLDQMGQKGSAQVAIKAVEHMGEVAVKGVTRTTERIGERALEGVGERVLERTGTRVVERSSERIVARLGRGLLISLPLIGGVFAVYLFQSDIHRVQEDLAERGKMSLASFVLATVADFVDSLLHFFMAYSLFRGASHHKLIVAEELSLTCAVVSTVCAVLGEIISHRRRRRLVAEASVQ
jgi:hypothetical protein